MTYDVAVVGAGIVGCATAWECARRGMSVVVLDRGEVSGGTTGLGEGNVLCSDKDAGPELELSVLGRELYGELEGLLGAAARIRRKGALIVHPLAETWAAEPARAERLRAAGVSCSLLDPEAVRAVELRLSGSLHGALHVPGDLQCDPRAIAHGLARIAADEHGAVVRTRSEVARLDDGAVLLRDGERVVARAIVLAAGPWTRPLAEGVGIALPLEPRKGQLSRFRLPVPDAEFLKHKIVDGSYLLSVTSTGTAREISTVVETTHDGHVIVGSTRERSGFDPSVDLALEQEVQQRASRLVPELATLQRDDAWVGFRPWLPDHLPAIGQARDGIWIATGHEGAGVALGPITGRIIAGALAGEPPPLDFSPFAPGRFA
jgi:D-hydroxyproline dehydrogenase subunit beta